MERVVERIRPVLDELSDHKDNKRIIDDYGIPTYPSPSSAVRSLAKILKYNLHSKVGR